MTTKRALQVIAVIGVLGMTFSGVLTYRELFAGAAACPAPGAAGTVFGYPACVYGFFMYLVLTAVAITGLRGARDRGTGGTP
jgi:uncharacterized membrane protein